MEQQLNDDSQDQAMGIKPKTDAFFITQARNQHKQQYEVAGNKKQIDIKLEAFYLYHQTFNTGENKERIASMAKHLYLKQQNETKNILGLLVYPQVKINFKDDKTLEELAVNQRFQNAQELEDYYAEIFKREQKEGEAIIDGSKDNLIQHYMKQRLLWLLDKLVNKSQDMYIIKNESKEFNDQLYNGNFEQIKSICQDQSNMSKNQKKKLKKQLQKEREEKANEEQKQEEDPGAADSNDAQMKSEDGASEKIEPKNNKEEDKTGDEKDPQDESDKDDSDEEIDIRDLKKKKFGYGECSICFDDDRYLLNVLVPCGHNGICKKCASENIGKNCPICRHKVESIMRVKNMIKDEFYSKI